MRKSQPCPVPVWHGNVGDFWSKCVSVHWVNPWTNTLSTSNSPRFPSVLLPQNWVSSNIESVFVYSCTQCSIYADKMEFTRSQSFSFVLCTCVIKWWNINIKRHCAILVTIDQSIVIIIIITCLLSMVRPFVPFVLHIPCIWGCCCHQQS